MSDYYSQFLSSVAGTENSPIPSDQDIIPTAQSPPGLPTAPNPAMRSSFQTLGRFTGFPEPLKYSGPRSERGRRRSVPGFSEKHRRTRSGCYTCRNRRVKCDEKRPICERCKKGSRECTYPDAATAKGRSSGQSSRNQTASPTWSHADDESDGDLKLGPVVNKDAERRENTASSKSARFPPQHSSSISSAGLNRIVTSINHPWSESPSLDGNTSLSPSVSLGTTSSLTPSTLHSVDNLVLGKMSNSLNWATMSRDKQLYLEYFQTNLTHYHYLLVSDPEDFFASTLVAMATEDEMLLNAVVGFAAYHHTLRNPAAKTRDFLEYYYKTISLLREFLQKGAQHNISFLLAILQLATIEEYLGDWANLLNHQKAACEVLTELYTPQTVMQSAAGRTILQWYARFDVFTGVIGCFRPTLPREWLTRAVEHYQARLEAEPANIVCKIEDCATRFKVICYDLAELFGKRAEGDLTEDQYGTEHQRMAQKLHDWKDQWDPTLTDSTYAVQDIWANRSSLEPLEDLVRPYTPGILYRPPIFTSTVLRCEWHGVMLMHSSQAPQDTSTSSPPELLKEHANVICQISEMVQLWPLSPRGSLILLNASLAIAALFVPQDSSHQSWMRRKFAAVESLGYITPLTVRIQMAELFKDPSCLRWWLPDDKDFTPILQQIRSFSDERSATAASAQTDNLRQIRYLFSHMRRRSS